MTTYQLHIRIDDETHVLTVPEGVNLRQTLLNGGFSPYAALTRRANCGGRGLCATCGVRFEAGEPPPVHWHDTLAANFGYPRLSCQIAVDRDMTIRIITEKIIWGARDGSARYRKAK